MMNLSNEICLFDTNVLIAYLSELDPNYFKIATFIKSIVAKETIIVLSSQNLFELAAVLTHAYHIPKKEVARRIEGLLSDPLIKVIYPNEATFKWFIDLLESENKLHISDIFLVATAKSHNVTTIVSGDKLLQKHASKLISIYNPFTTN